MENPPSRFTPKAAIMSVIVTVIVIAFMINNQPAPLSVVLDENDDGGRNVVTGRPNDIQNKTQNQVRQPQINTRRTSSCANRARVHHVHETCTDIQWIMLACHVSVTCNFQRVSVSPWKYCFNKFLKNRAAVLKNRCSSLNRIHVASIQHKKWLGIGMANASWSHAKCTFHVQQQKTLCV